ncbi:MAG TPA: aminoglycoside phosphotransferase family protein [Anaerolineae bacterium]|nr:aminoglycoside phosphotransferase family protein [Anaerolineae bacterium]HOR00895.1 aminoglycoside phosphotransferase family protein [Anaerolineae bacterium]HPL29794.1 aminoglycoside phosphotransferase family protein [Anaerolineae bacterium]
MIGTRLRPLLDHLASERPEAAEAWRGWRIERIAGGHNGLVYRATDEAADLAVKFTPRDARDRAGREYHALNVLQHLGLDLAPEPILLERDRYEHPVVVQSWLEGTVSPCPPRDEAEWTQLARHYAAIHAVTPTAGAGALPRAVITGTRAQHALERLAREVARIPSGAQPAELRALVAQAEGMPWPAWPQPAFVLCRVDPNPLNFIRRPGRWASVDWENSGWGDPAFEIADLLACPAYAAVSRTRWEGFVAACFEQCADATATIRVGTYYVLTLAWWAALSARLRYEIAHGLEERRLVERPAGWREQMPRQYEQCLARAQQALVAFAERPR